MIFDVVAIQAIRCTGCGAMWRLYDNRRPRAGAHCPTCFDQGTTGRIIPPSRRVRLDLVGEGLGDTDEPADRVRLFDDGQVLCT